MRAPWDEAKADRLISPNERPQRGLWAGAVIPNRARTSDNALGKQTKFPIDLWLQEPELLAEIEYRAKSAEGKARELGASRRSDPRLGNGLLTDGTSSTGTKRRNTVFFYRKSTVFSIERGGSGDGYSHRRDRL